MAGHASGDVLCFDSFRLDRQSGGLFRADRSGSLIPVALGSRALELLDFLARRKGEPISKDEIMTVVWSGRAVEEANLNVQVSKLRHILDEHRPHGSCIQTITGFGYRFIAEVTSVDRLALAASCPTTGAPTAKPLAMPRGHHLSEPAWRDDGATGYADKVARLAPPEWPSRRGEGEPSLGHIPRDPADSSFLINRLGAAGVIDQDVTVALRELQRRLIDDYGDGAAARTLIDQVIAAYQDFVRLTGWITNLSTMIEHELFGGDGYEGHSLCHHPVNESASGEATAEQHLVCLHQSLLPLVERRALVMREALAALEAFRASPSRTATALLGHRSGTEPKSVAQQRCDVSARSEIIRTQPFDFDFC